MKAQANLPLPAALPDGAYHFGQRSDGESHGVVLTKPHIVELLLDLAGYTVDRPLHSLRLLEPSCGHGAFVVEAVRRLLASAHENGVDPRFLTSAITAFDIDPTSVERTAQAVIDLLVENGLPLPHARDLASTWIRTGDFLLAEPGEAFDVIVGNPPYIRIEQLSPALQAEYRARFQTLFDRADIYVAFIERSLQLLSAQGLLSFICADRWIRNKYGGPLRDLITSSYDLRLYIDLHRASPFESEVIAYPSIFVIGKEKSSAPVRVAALQNADEHECKLLRQALSKGKQRKANDLVAEYPEWFRGTDPWVITSPEHQHTLKQLETAFQPLEEFAKVGIGVASGCDRVYLVDEDVDIEPDRLVPIVMRSDISNGKIKDAGRLIINPFGDDGKVIELSEWPRLARYLNDHRAALQKRHVAKRSGRAWFRTIDRVYPELVKRPKLLIPDIAGSNEVVFDPGHYHPHHNLYYISSDTWDLEVLGGLLSSQVALFFIWSYAVKMRGGYLRFQAQYLRRIRVPAPKDLPARLARSLKDAFRKRDFATLDRLALKAYGLTALPPFDFVDTRT